MQNFTLANILLKIDDFTAEYPGIYYTTQDLRLPAPEGAPRIATARTIEGATRYIQDEGCLEFSGAVDFGTYFNALSLAKWMRYTVARSFWLHLELAGDAALILFTELTGNAKEAVHAADILAESEASDSFVAYDIELPISFATLVGFSLETYGTAKVRNAYYYTKVADSSIREVDIALCTTTFRKEDYVIPNIEAVKRSVLESGEPIAQHFHMFVVDNGRTLDENVLELNPQRALKSLEADDAPATGTTGTASTASAVSAEGPSRPAPSHTAPPATFAGVTVIPNPNVGGAGGFARGMMAALDAGATHALLMDDDVRVSPESFKRTFNLLSLLNERYQDAFLNGAMLALEAPNMQYEDVAYIRRVTTYERVKGDIRIDSPLDIVENERINVEVPNAYGAWWYCCIPTSAIRKHGLPLPLFVRGDDVEYGMRCKPTIMTMGGICVWHAQFEGRWRSSIDCYQFQRNFRIAMACDDECDEFWYMFFFKRAFYSALRGLNYEEAELLLDALEDYTKGPDFLENAPANDLFMGKGRKNERLTSVEELKEQNPDVMSRTTRPNMEKALNPKATATDKLVWYAGCVCAPLPFNLHMLPDALLRDEPFGVYYTRPMVPLEPTMRRRTLVAFDADGTAASIRTLDRTRYRQIMDRWRQLQDVLRTRGPEIERSWRAAQPYLTSRDFWESYLKANR